ncbi:DUF4250 domain-containing protein [Motilimonas sp. E26]|uniref:DUF4250 domain-containing protein n=1 Tax=Motilimonas sp. E26 TaxID=2865674 RepID=UPI001E46335C|nr:DUF4250 domain-containing protein [Motilimonas sp. E26]MCE0558429.1 DUF4250 domain-containing protein [Motilimonas sp. E26]
MNFSQYLTMDINMLLSIVNMKLRDEGEQLDDFCQRYELDKTQLELRLNNHGWFYQSSRNQFSQTDQRT